MPSNNIVPIFHSGLAGKFVPADGMMQGSITAGIPYKKLQWPTGTPLRMYAGRLNFVMGAESGDFLSTWINLPNFTGKPEQPDMCTWSEITGDLDGQNADQPWQTELGEEFLGLCLSASVTARGAPLVGTPNEIVQVTLQSSDTVLAQYNLIDAPASMDDPTAAAPWWGSAQAATNTTRVLPTQSWESGEELRLWFAISGGAGLSGHIDVCVVTKGS